MEIEFQKFVDLVPSRRISSLFDTDSSISNFLDL